MVYMEGIGKGLEGSISTSRIHEEFSSNVAKLLRHESHHIAHAHISFEMISSDIDQIVAEGTLFVRSTRVCVPEPVQY